MSQTHPHQPKSSSGAAVGVSVAVIVLVALGVVVVICVVAAAILLLPAVMQVRQGVRAVEAEAQFREVGLAFFDYHDRNRRLPSAVITADDGTPLRSWRAELLPYLDRSDVYDRLDLTKPWNAPENHFLTGTEMFPFHSAMSTDDAEFTNMVAVVGPGTVFDPNARRPTTLEAIQDGTSNTILLIEIRESDIPWYEPRDVTIDEAVALIKDPAHRTGTIVLYADGSARKILPDVNEAVLRSMFTHSAGD